MPRPRAWFRSVVYSTYSGFFAVVVVSACFAIFFDIAFSSYFLLFLVERIID